MSFTNDDLEFLNEPRVKPAAGVPSHEDDYYVSGLALLKKSSLGDFYLHSDGRWHTSALSIGASGYFSSAAEAERVFVSVLPSLKRHATFEHDLSRREAVRRCEAGMYASK